MPPLPSFFLVFFPLQSEFWLSGKPCRSIFQSELRFHLHCGNCLLFGVYFLCSGELLFLPVSGITDSRCLYTILPFRRKSHFPRSWILSYLALDGTVTAFWCQLLEVELSNYLLTSVCIKKKNLSISMLFSGYIILEEFLEFSFCKLLNSIF